MKKLIFLVALALTTALSYGQISLISSIDGTKSDTLSDAGTLYFTTPISSLLSEKTGSYRVQYTSTNVSGTSTFKVILQGSIDGVNYTNMHQVAGTTGVNCDTLQVTSNSPSSWIFRSFGGGTTNAGRVKTIRLKIVGTGTQKTYISNVQLFPQY